MKLPYSRDLRRLWAVEKFGYSTRTFLAMASTMGLCSALDRPSYIIPLFLGIIASALAETDDRWQDRLWALVVTLICFSVASFAVELLFPYPIFFATCLVLSTFALIMLGALGERYATIAQATLILAIYTMIAADQRPSEAQFFWRSPLLLILGAAWYGFFSVFWSALFSHQPVQQALARLYRELARCFRLKAAMLEPRTQMDIQAQRLELAQQNGRVVTALNAAKNTLLPRMGQARNGDRMRHYLQLYFLAQDLHERIISSHYPYRALARSFFHSDVLYRCQRVLRLQSRACLNLADTIVELRPFRYGEATTQAMEELDTAIAHLEAQERSDWRTLLHSLKALSKNLRRVQRQLARAVNPDSLAYETDTTLVDNQPHSLRQGFERLQDQLNLDALRCRHAIRMGLALLAGYTVLHMIHPGQGYWILLTTVFVCQPNYGATQLKMVQRITGTVAGLIVGWGLFWLFPDLQTQAWFAVLAGVVFFANRTTHYTLATAAITLMVLFCFNQTGNSHDLIWPRLLDTLIGTAIAALAVFLILPDWQGRRLHLVAANTLLSHAAYLQEIMTQYDTGKQDDLEYRIARRSAHNADAALSMALSNMLLEPGQFRQDAEAGFRFLALSHTLLGYLSGLGAHREVQAENCSDQLQAVLAQYLSAYLQQLGQAVQQQTPLPELPPLPPQVSQGLDALVDKADTSHQLVLSQLGHSCRLLPRLRQAAQCFITQSGHDVAVKA